MARCASRRATSTPQAEDRSEVLFLAGCCLNYEGCLKCRDLGQGCPYRKRVASWGFL